MSRKPIVALSVRQPYAEMILRGEKRIEYRSRPTHRRGTVYLYASQSAGSLKAYRDIGLSHGDLPLARVVGTVEITACRKGATCFEWDLENPVRFRRPRRTKRQPMPTFFFPFAAAATS